MNILDFILGHYAYWFTFILMMIGLYGMMMKKNLVKKLIGMNIFQVSIIIFYVSTAVKWGGTVPVLDPNISVANTANYINPLPHCLMLTAIVVGVAEIFLDLICLRSRLRDIRPVPVPPSDMKFAKFL